MTRLIAADLNALICNFEEVFCLTYHLPFSFLIFSERQNFQPSSMTTSVSQQLQDLTIRFEAVQQELALVRLEKDEYAKEVI